MKGRKPLPTSLKFRMSKAKAAASAAQEVQPPKAPLRCPARLKGAARKAWKQAASMLPWATATDAWAIETLVVLWARLCTANAAIEKEGVLSRGRDGRMIQNSNLRISSRTTDEIKWFMSEFGMTPSSRTRIKTNAAESGDAIDRLKARFKKKA